jgi:Leucine-rich repeat (LRR) protein|tara:strand:+ start:171 stop:773 length:603 start_codon:yes stop_codon:yes gene_type:complete
MTRSSAMRALARARARVVAARARGGNVSSSSKFASMTTTTTTRPSDDVTARTLLEANGKRFDVAMPRGVALQALLLARSDDLKCVDIMCQWVGDACACRLARALDRRGEALRVLDVSGNRLRALPSAVWAMRALEVLDASDNALTPADVPFDDLMDETKDVAPNLKVLNLRGNVAVIDGLEGRLREVVDAMARRGVKLVL